MKNLTLNEICTAVGGRWLGQPSQRARSLVAIGVSTDSRTAAGEQLYIPIVGDRFDGHDFLPAAAEAGCIAALVGRQYQPTGEMLARFDGGLIQVADTRKALGDLAAFHRSSSAAAVVAVTGSNGKTTTKRMIEHILRTRLKGTVSPKSFNNDIGVPLTLLSADQADQYVLCELGTNAPGEIGLLTRIAQPDVAVITSVSETHLEKLGSLEKVAAEKASILDALAPEGVGIVWADSEVLAKAVRPYGRRLIRFGQAAEADIRLTAYQPTAAGQNFTINGRLNARMAIGGRHMALNALAAIATAGRFGFSLQEAAEALADFSGVQMRLERLTCGSVTLFNDAYNANPASLLAGAQVLAETPTQGRRVLIAGDMRELGEHAADIHLRTGAQLAAMSLDLLIGVGELGRYIAHGAAQGGAKTQSFDSVEPLGQAVGSLLRQGDLVLIKGSRAMKMESLVGPICQAFGPMDGSEAGH